MKRFWSDRKLEQEAERSQQEARMQTNITVNRTTARVMQSVEKNACDHLENVDHSVFSGPALSSGSRVLGQHSAHSTYIPSAADQKHPRDPLGGLDEASQKTARNACEVLSGVLHVDEEHAHLSKDEILQIRRDVLQTFYTNAQQGENLKRAQAARDHWVTWCELWSSIELSASLAADQGAESTLDTTPIIDSIMAAYGDCKAKNILPALFMALHVFRKFNMWSKLRSEADCAMAMVGPILEEVLQIQHEVKFTR
ncbi:hypothetical protein BGX29_008796 [Mortierella sp. GBA35]|nr:hypothetical protein BGX29_008796 [Mortierella sp. GBA35]